MTSVLELEQFLEALCPPLLSGAGQYRAERAQLALHLLCASQLSLGVCGECAPFLRLLLQLLPTCAQVSESPWGPQGRRSPAFLVQPPSSTVLVNGPRVITMATREGTGVRPFEHRVLI